MEFVLHDGIELLGIIVDAGGKNIPRFFVKSLSDISIRWTRLTSSSK